MITNPEVFINKFKCGKIFADYLIYHRHLPLLSVDKNYYYFVQNDEFDNIFEDIPIWIKAIRWL